MRAIELHPSDPNNHLFYSNSFLSPHNRHDEAIAEMKTAIALDPLSFPVQSFFGRTLAWAHRDDEALAQFKKANQMNPNIAVGRCSPRPRSGSLTTICVSRLIAELSSLEASHWASRSRRNAQWLIPRPRARPRPNPP